jgi:(p)ppGpp synthase/HD superfamily hydrolase
MENKAGSYCDSYYSLEEIEKDLFERVECLDMNKISSAYDISEKTCSKHSMPGGSNFFYHATRVVEILIKELKIYDSELISAALLYNAAKVSSEFDTTLIDYNFDPYVAYLVDVMLEDFDFPAKIAEGTKTLKREDTGIKIDDYLVLMCTEQLDFLRCVDYDLTGNHFEYINKITKQLFPLISKSENAKVGYLYTELKAEINKILS